MYILNRISIIYIISFVSLNKQQIICICINIEYKINQHLAKNLHFIPFMRIYMSDRLGIMN